MNPALRLVCADPVVKDALSSILGDGYFMHPRRHGHQNRSGTPARGTHKDSYEEDVNPPPSFPTGHGDVLPAGGGFHRGDTEQSVLQFAVTIGRTR